MATSLMNFQHLFFINPNVIEKDMVRDLQDVGEMEILWLYGLYNDHDGGAVSRIKPTSWYLNRLCALQCRPRARVHSDHSLIPSWSPRLHYSFRYTDLEILLVCNFCTKL